MKEVKFHTESIKEIENAVIFYKEKEKGLHIRFLDALEDAVRRISQRPEMYRIIEGEIRKCRIPRFPFGLIYKTAKNQIVIVAVMHIRRKPGYWKKRT